MTDYKSLWLKRSPAPHIRAREEVSGMLLDVIIALLPALLFAVYHFGIRALLVTLVSVSGCVAFESVSCVLLHRHQTVGDLSAVVTGLLIAFVCPVTVPFWMVLVGDFFAIVVVKQLYGGIGRNFLNPALAGHAVMLLLEGAMSVRGEVDMVTSSTPMAYLHAGDLALLLQAYDYNDLVVGHVAGSIGEVSALCLLLGFVWLVLQRVVRWVIPVSFVGTVALLTFLFPMGHTPVDWMLCHVLSGGLLLAAIFMATDCVTSPVSRRGQLVFGVGCGAITVFLRYFGSANEGVTCAVLCMNLLVWNLDKRMRPRRFGVSRAALLRRLALRVKETEGGAVALVKEKAASVVKTVKSRSLLANLAALFSGVRERLELVADPPAILRGIPITIITALLMLLALSGFVGVRL